MMDRHNTATGGELLTGCSCLFRGYRTTGACAHQLRRGARVERTVRARVWRKNAQGLWAAGAGPSSLIRSLQNEDIANVEWHFFASDVSGTIGADPRTIEGLTREVVPAIPFFGLLL